MCTASWLIRSDGFELFFNRDESRSRLEAHPPEFLEVDGVRCLAPIDANAGGTWIGANERGVAVAVLNAWEDTAQTELPTVSRGELVRSLLSAGSQKEVAERLHARELRVFRGFRLVVLEAGSEPVVHAWQNRTLGLESVAMPLASSSKGAELAHARRREVLERLGGPGSLELSELEHFHRSHEPERGAWSPCMHREDASTVSSSHVSVGPREVRIRYAPGPPCRTVWGPTRSLARAHAPEPTPRPSR